MELMVKKSQSTILGEKTYEVTSFFLKDGKKQIQYETIDESQIQYLFATDRDKMRVNIMSNDPTMKAEAEDNILSLIFLRDGRVIASLTRFKDFRLQGWESHEWSIINESVEHENIN